MSKAIQILLFGLVGEELSEAIEPAFPERTSIADPAFDKREALRFDATCADSSNFFRLYEPAFLEHLQVLHNCGERDFQWLCQAGNGDRTGAVDCQANT
jgi:hypothetical protein